MYLRSEKDAIKNLREKLVKILYTKFTQLGSQKIKKIILLNK